jgi:hypothetical protein
MEELRSVKPIGRLTDIYTKLRCAHTRTHAHTKLKQSLYRPGQALGVGPVSTCGMEPLRGWWRPIGPMMSSMILQRQSRIFWLPTRTGARGDAVVEALRYKPEGSGIDSRWCHWKFFIDIILSLYLCYPYRCVTLLGVYRRTQHLTC